MAQFLAHNTAYSSPARYALHQRLFCAGHHSPHRFRTLPIEVFRGPYLEMVGTCYRCGQYIDANRHTSRGYCQRCTPYPILEFTRDSIDWEDESNYITMPAGSPLLF